MVVWYYEHPPARLRRELAFWGISVTVAGCPDLCV